MEIFEVDDMAGIDVAWRVRKEHRQLSGAGERKAIVADALCEMGCFGQKTGKGWYLYPEGKPVPDPEVLELIHSLSGSIGIPQRTFTDAEIIQRAFCDLINEGAKALEEGYALRASDIDVIYTNGYGFPAWRGGPMFYADSVGLKKIVERIRDFDHELGVRWKLSPLLEKLADAGKTFRIFDEEHAVQN